MKMLAFLPLGMQAWKTKRWSGRWKKKKKKKKIEGGGERKREGHSCFGTLWVWGLCYMCLPFNCSSFYLLHVHVGDCRPPSRRIVLHKYTKTDGTSHLCKSKQTFWLLWQRRKNLFQNLEETVHPKNGKICHYLLTFILLQTCMTFLFSKGWILKNVLFTLEFMH